VHLYKSTVYSTRLDDDCVVREEAGAADIPYYYFFYLFLWFSIHNSLFFRQDFWLARCYFAGFVVTVCYLLLFFSTTLVHHSKNVVQSVVHFTSLFTSKLVCKLAVSGSEFYLGFLKILMLFGRI